LTLAKALILLAPILIVFSGAVVLYARTKTPDGWLNRLLEVLPGTRNSTDAISVGPTLPRILSGRISTTNLPLNPAGIRPTATDRRQIQAAFDRLYNGNDPLSVAYREGQSGRKKLMAELAEDMKMADG